MSSTTGLEPHGHPIARFATRLHHVLDELTEIPAWSMTPDRATDRAGRPRPRRGPPRRAPAPGPRRRRHRRHRRRLRRHLHRSLGRAPHPDHPPRCARRRTLAQPWTGTTRSADALEAGHVDLAQARVIVRAITALPPVSPPVSGTSRRSTSHAAGEHDAAALKLLGRRVFEVIDPDAADLEEGRRLEAEEAAAARATSLHLYDNGDGTHTGRFKIPSLHAAMLTKMLHASSPPPARHRPPPARHAPPAAHSTGSARQPDRPAPASTWVSTGSDGVAARTARSRVLPPPRTHPRRPTPHRRRPLRHHRRPPRLRQAPHRPRHRPPRHRPTPLRRPRPPPRLRGRHHPRRLPTRPRRALGHPRHGPQDPPAHRTQRIALALRDGGCTTEELRPPTRLDRSPPRHPLEPAADHDLDNGRLLCRFHHQRAHSPPYQTEHLPNGQIRFHRRN